MNILVVDDHPFIHEFLGGVVRAVFGDPAVHVAASLAESLEKAACVVPLDLVLLDLGLPDSIGVATLVQFRHAHPQVRVVVFSAVDEPSTVVGALAAGAAGYLPKTSPLPVIAAALRLVAAGGIYVPPQAIDEAAAARGQRREIALTDRQVDVLRLILRGMANKEIAKRLHIAKDTVKQHAGAAYATLGVSSRTQAILAVARRGIRLD